MAIAAALVGQGSAASTSTTTASGTSSASGSTFLVGLSYDASTTVSSVTDSKSNTYSKVGSSYDSGGGLVEWWKCENGTGGSGHTATASFSGTAYAVVYLIEVTDAETSSGIDAITGGVDTPTLAINVPASGSFAQADEVILAICGSSSGGTVVYGDSTGTFTKLGTEEDGDNYWTSAVWSRVIASTSQITTGFTLPAIAASFDRAGSVLSIKQFTGGGSQDESGGSVAQITVTATGAGTSSEGESGGSTASISVTASGAGTAAEAASGGSVASIAVTTPGGSAATLGQHGSQRDEVGSGSSPLDITLNAAAGSSFLWISSSKVLSTDPADSGGDFTRIQARRTYSLWSDYGLDLFHKLTAAGGSGYEVTADKSDATDEAVAFLLEIINGATLIDSATNEILAGNDLVAPSVTTEGPALLICGWFGDAAAGPFTADPNGGQTGWTVVEEWLDLVTNYIQASIAVRTVSAAGTYNATWLETPDQGAIMFTAAYAGPPAGIATETPSGGAVASISVAASGAGNAVESASGGSTAAIDVIASGAGVAAESASGGSVASITVTATGGGQANGDESGGSTATITVAASGAGIASESASGGSVASITVTATGGGQIEGDESGGSVASILVTATGAGTATETPAGGSVASVSVTATGAGAAIEQASGGSVAHITVTAYGATSGPYDHEGGSVARILVRAYGGGTKKRPLDPGSGRNLHGGTGRNLRQAA